jgi:hypothetical protein
MVSLLFLDIKTDVYFFIGMALEEEFEYLCK